MTYLKTRIKAWQLLPCLLLLTAACASVAPKDPYQELLESYANERGGVAVQGVAVQGVVGEGSFTSNSDLNKVKQQHTSYYGGTATQFTVDLYRVNKTAQKVCVTLQNKATAKVLGEQRWFAFFKVDANITGYNLLNNEKNNLTVCTWQSSAELNYAELRVEDNAGKPVVEFRWKHPKFPAE